MFRMVKDTITKSKLQLGGNIAVNIIDKDSIAFVNIKGILQIGKNNLLENNSMENLKYKKNMSRILKDRACL